jgi:hypothetical protein
MALFKKMIQWYKNHLYYLFHKIRYLDLDKILMDNFKYKVKLKMDKLLLIKFIKAYIQSAIMGSLVIITIIKWLVNIKIIKQDILMYLN